MKAIVSAADQVLAKKKFCSYLKPYWNRNLKDLYATMGQARRRSVAEGRQRGNDRYLIVVINMLSLSSFDPITANAQKNIFLLKMLKPTR